LPTVFPAIIEGRMPATTTDDAEILLYRSTAGACFGRFIDALLFVDVQRNGALVRTSFKNAL
jgi:hypothetical protein